MKKGLLVAAAGLALFAFNAEARDVKGHGGHQGGPAKVQHQGPKGGHNAPGHGRNDVRHGGKHNNVVVINRDYYRPRPRTYYSYSYVSQPLYVVPQPVEYVVYNEPYYYAPSPLQSVFFSNRNFSFGFSNFLW